MKSKQVKKSILLFMVLCIGVYFLIGCAQKEESWNRTDYDRNQDYKDLNISDKLKYEELAEMRDSLLGEKHKLIFKKNPTESDRIKEARIDSRVRTIRDQMDKIFDESKGSCFPKNTKVVMSDGSLKAIDTIIKGDQVMIYDIANDTIGSSSVKEKYIDDNNHMYILNSSIQATSYERFLTQDGWKRMHSITTTDSVFNGNSFIDVNSMSKVKKDLTVYNLNINSTHNFFVSYGQDDEWFLIHNSGGDGGSGGGGK